MEISIRKTPGLRNDLLLVLPRSEVEDVRLHIASRERLMGLPGLVRHIPEQDPAEREAVNDCKVCVEDHLRSMSTAGRPLLDGGGNPMRRLIAVGARNLGNNHNAIAWQHDLSPRLFKVRGDPMNLSRYCCITWLRERTLALRDLSFAGDRVLDNDTDISGVVDWCAYGSPILRGGEVLSLDKTISEYSDIRHVLAFVRESPEGRHIEKEIFQNYPESYRENTLRAWREQGVPRQRFLHNALGLSKDHIFIVQREGTPEEVANWLKEAGAADGILLDNGASVFCWAWWLHPKGGFLFAAPDYRPPASAIVAFVLKGAPRVSLPTGSVSFTIL